ncbi:MAG TPA: alginate lyase family protein [Flavisolibacter sp.]|jgi:hypothetical protein|nr:alginate lyase family protein [Flavisolibacter sp.]
MKPVLFVAFSFCFAIALHAQLPTVYLMDGAYLAAIKQKASSHDTSAQNLISALRRKADPFLTMKPVSVMDKEFVPASGNKHDYMSQAPYFWYDSTKPNGLPYKRRDGERNPEIYKITDKKYLDQMEGAIKTLSLAWYFTGEKKYADKASSLIRYWFTDTATRMNPNLDYGQAIPGINTGRGIGIIESRTLTGIVDAIGLLQNSDAWKPADTKALQQWYSQFLQWMLTSKNGKEEHAAKNNHGTFYYVQVIDFALFAGEKEKARQLALESKALLDSQLTAEGSQPLELERTRALSYSSMNLAGWFDVARLAEKAGVDLWKLTTSKGATIRTALDWLSP